KSFAIDTRPPARRQRGERPLLEWTTSPALVDAQAVLQANPPRAKQASLELPLEEQESRLLPDSGESSPYRRPQPHLAPVGPLRISLIGVHRTPCQAPSLFRGELLPRIQLEVAAR